MIQLANSSRELKPLRMGLAVQVTVQFSSAFYLVHHADKQTARCNVCRKVFLRRVQLIPLEDAVRFHHADCIMTKEAISSKSLSFARRYCNFSFPISIPCTPLPTRRKLSIEHPSCHCPLRAPLSGEHLLPCRGQSSSIALFWASRLIP